jgi:gliding motility-associated-like protein
MNSKFTLVFLIIFTSIIHISAKHIVGGEVIYKLVSTDGYVGGKVIFDIKMTIYRDAKSGGADFDSPGYFGVFRKGQISWVFQKRIDEYVKNRQYIENVHDPCIVSPPNILYEKGEYSFRLELPIIDSSYIVSYQRCCRTNYIVNVLSPEATGASYFIEITPQAQLEGNNSPQFTNFPPSVLCANSFFEFDHSATDIDGDSLVYEFFNPFHGGGLNGSEPGTGGNANDCDGVKPLPDNCPPPFPLVRFRNPYTFYDPIGGSPKVMIDRISGIITGKPLDLGQFVVGVRVLEFRKEKLIGVVMRDFQFNVTSCSPAVKAVIANGSQTDINKFEIIACGTDTVTFINKSFDRDKIFDVSWKFNLIDTIYETSDWDATVVFPGPGFYTGQLFLNRNTVCDDSTDLVIKVFPGIHAKYNISQDSCIAFPVLFNNESYSEGGPIKKYNWEFGDGSSSSVENPEYLYQMPGIYFTNLVVEDVNKCQDTFSLPVSYFPVPDKIDFKPSHYLGCTPVAVKFNNFSSPFSDEYEIKWDFGDGATDTIFSPTHIYEKEGIYTIKVKIKSPLGCEVENEFENLLEIRKGPLADFDYNPKKPNILNPKISFINKSEDAKYYFWDFGTGVHSFDFEPEYYYPDTGLYSIELIVTAENHCDDTIVKNIYISPEITLFFPNAFTPNGDGVNDDFFPKGINPQYIKDYKLTIWNRWGGLVFETYDPLARWQGSKNNSGGILPQGVYVYKFSFKNPRGEIETGKGFVTLIK